MRTKKKGSNLFYQECFKAIKNSFKKKLREKYTDRLSLPWKKIQKNPKVWICIMTPIVTISDSHLKFSSVLKCNHLEISGINFIQFGLDLRPWRKKTTHLRPFFPYSIVSIGVTSRDPPLPPLLVYFLPLYFHNLWMLLVSLDVYRVLLLIICRWFSLILCHFWTIFW